MSESILDQLQNGVTDVPISRPGPESEVHLMHQVGTLPMKALERAVTVLRAASFNKQVSTEKNLELVDPRFLLMHAWSQHRLDESKRLLMEGFDKDDDSVPGIHPFTFQGCLRIIL